jgi:hypothetical protein
MRQTGPALTRTGKTKKIPLPKSSGGVLTVSLRLFDMLAVEIQLIREEDGLALQALIQGWRSVRERVVAGTMNPIAWLDDVLCELAEMKVWVPPIFLKRLRQLQRGELRLETAAGQRISPVAHHGLPQPFQAAIREMGMQVHVVRTLSGGYEDLTTRMDATEAVEEMCRAWIARPTDKSEAEGFLRAAAVECGWRISP